MANLERIKEIKAELEKIDESRNERSQYEGNLYMELFGLSRIAVRQYIATLDLKWKLYYSTSDSRFSCTGRDFTDDERNHINSLVSDEINYHWHFGIYETNDENLTLSWDDNVTSLSGSNEAMLKFLIANEIKVDVSNLNKAIEKLTTDLKLANELLLTFKTNDQR